MGYRLREKKKKVKPLAKTGSLKEDKNIFDAYYKKQNIKSKFSTISYGKKCCE